MRSSYCRHGGFYTALLAASLRQMRRGLAGAKEGTASLVCTHSIATIRAPRALSRLRRRRVRFLGRRDPCRDQPARLIESSRVLSPSGRFCSARKLLNDAAPVPVMAANDELTRMREEVEELRAKHDSMQEVIRDLQRRRRSPSPSSSSDDDSSSSSSSSDGASRKRRRGRKKKSRRKSRRRRSRSRSMSPASLAEARARATCNREEEAYFEDLRTYHARYMAAVAQARRRKLARDFDREQDRALARIEFDDYRDYPCRCGRGPKRARVAEIEDAAASD